MEEFPNDEDGNALRSLKEEGLDLSKEVEIEFAVDSPDEASSKEIAAAMTFKGFPTKIVYDEGELEEGEEITPESEEFAPSWTVYSNIRMVPEHGEIIRIQEELDEISKPFGGKSDGWGIWF